jgi:protein dithiol oxidoreductase (disulfide-forming)
MQRRDFTQHLTGSALGLAGWALSAQASAQGAPKEGTHYVRLANAAPVTLPTPDKKIEVVEFFWYGCPHCYAFEPVLEAWVKKLPADVAFRQVPVGFMAPHQLHQKLFYALEETGQMAGMHRKVFAAIHQQNKKLMSEGEIKDVITAAGGDGAKVVEAMKGFGVSTKANRAKQLADAYKIDGVPALGINGRFYTAASLAGGHERAVAVADYLIQLSRQKA